MKIGISIATAVLLAAGIAWFLRGPAPRESPPSTPVLAAAPGTEPSPTAGDLAFAEITAGWSAETREACAKPLRDVLGTRDLVQGALDGVHDPAGKATDEIRDAHHWLAEGDASLEKARPALTEGVCTGATATLLEQATQHYIKVGTAAVQAASIAAS